MPCCPSVLFPASAPPVSPRDVGGNGSGNVSAGDGIRLSPYGQGMPLLADAHGADFWVAISSAAVALIGVIVAVVAAVHARRAAAAADESVSLAKDELTMARREHEVFLKELTARARFDLTLKSPQADDDGVIRTEGSGMWPRLEIGIANLGNKAAGPTTLNVLLPRHLEYARWCGPMGEDIPDVAPPADTAEVLPDGQGGEVPAMYLTEVLPRVGRRDHPVRWVRFSVHVPDSGQMTIPLRVRASADELSDDESEPLVDVLLRIERAAR